MVALILFAPVAWILTRGATPVLSEDDGYYYAVIGRHLALNGVSTFDGHTLTNGYHPLWQWLVALTTRLAGPGALPVLGLEALLMGAGFTFLAVASGARNGWWLAIFAAADAHYVGAMAMAGMEVSLLACAVGVFVWWFARRPDEGAGPWAEGAILGLTAAFCGGARIEAALFVGAAVVLAPKPWRVRIMAIAVMAGLGLVYLSYNKLMFGAGLPISSAIKSIGGVQLNRLYLAQLVADAHHPLGHSRHLLTMLLVAVTPALGFLAPAGSASRRFAWAVGLGGVAFFAKLLFMSSWRIWPWYDFPLAFVMAAALLVLTPRVEAVLSEPTRPAKLLRMAMIAAAFATTLGLARQTAYAAIPRDGGGFAALNERAARRFAGVLGGRGVAMGDRAGSFAAAYSGSVTQLEGLVNDIHWLDLIKAKTPDLTPELCARRVAFLLSWQPKVHDYDRLSIPVMRPDLTQFRAPTVTVRSVDQVGEVYDPSVYDDSPRDIDNHLYLWRLHCRQRPSGGGQAVAPAPP